MPGEGAGVARVGPNAITQTAASLRAAGGETLARAMFGAAGLAPYLSAPPDEMVAEQEAARLHAAIAAGLPPAQAAAVARDAGRRTGAYILAHRIPKPVQKLLRWLPPRLAAPVLLAAIRRHAWTFAGSGDVTTTAGRSPVLTIARNPLATPGCPWHCAVLETLFRALVAADTHVEETACCATGASACRFVFRRGAPER